MRENEHLPSTTEKIPLWRVPGIALKVALSHDYNKISPELYEAYVERFSRRSEQAKRLSALLSKYMSPVSSDSVKREVLDIAAGTGKISRALEEQGYNVTATDMSEKALEALQQRSPFIATKQANMNDGLPFADNVFDAATSVWANRYIKGTDSFLKDVARVLKPGGVFIWPIYPAERFIWKMKRGIRQHTTSKSLKREALSAGFNEATIVKSASLESTGRARIPFHSRSRYLVLKK